MKFCDITDDLRLILVALTLLKVKFEVSSERNKTSQIFISAFLPYVTKETVEDIAMVPLVAVLLFMAGGEENFWKFQFHQKL